MQNAKIGDRVRVDYVIRFKDSTQVSTSRGRQNLEFTLGEGKALQEFEDALIDMEAGKARTVVISPDLAFGPQKNELLGDMKIDDSPIGTPSVAGHTILIKQSGGHTISATAKASDRNRLFLEGENIFEDKELVMDIKLVEILS
ncbi:peptidylprolyl isomerase [Desulfonema ishimotonii]|uniref:Peptidyl-prolyl cis-trans isomerase n=1 Tax=Desulfonema ishimotonii TaxID=45657 RepID=A0A401G0K5_9BACT|nr:FKBP-type peptidyl-prolyl cis-trans isomerase [Desulfonema ishimotonii]GBC62726.1 peptidylprolyl isomerase [Desulfonema ishimotonii]